MFQRSKKYPVASIPDFGCRVVSTANDDILKNWESFKAVVWSMAANPTSFEHLFCKVRNLNWVAAFTREKKTRFSKKRVFFSRVDEALNLTYFFILLWLINNKTWDSVLKIWEENIMWSRVRLGGCRVIENKLFRNAQKKSFVWKFWTKQANYKFLYNNIYYI